MNTQILGISRTRDIKFGIRVPLYLQQIKLILHFRCHVQLGRKTVIYSQRFQSIYPLDTPDYHVIAIYFIGSRALQKAYICIYINMMYSNVYEYII